ncbi:MAG: class I SAM-dependent methyltransferase [Anaerolineaceae bacterium]|nr:class I SAM-dependent methyltransferase [Anaerolineaceae bacterium]MDD4042260.1 class I SAM-dependent methyltransferase [Anaerolineaceae bacterium]MDD4578195.1 class I SAM-dependent methyltransferase [Anaerolineaceae bacterium]
MAARRQAIIEFLERFRKSDLSKLRILEMGCGSGGVLQEFISLDADPSKLYGVDLLHDRLRVAIERLPDCSYITANGEHLPFPSCSFDLVLQFTAFSSILDASTKVLMASEMVRVLKPGQGILWYDFVWNPLNRQTRGIPLSEIKKLFPGLQVTSRRITLAPPLTRLLVPRFQALANELTRLPFLNSHLIIWIQKPN